VDRDDSSSIAHTHTVVSCRKTILHILEVEEETVLGIERLVVPFSLQ
jgi:hypothetical protein